METPEVDTLLDIQHAEKMDWLLAEDSDAGYHDLTDEEIVTLVLEENKDDGDNDEKEKRSPAVSHAQAFSALETVLAYVQEQQGIPVSTTVMLNSLLIETATKKRYISQKQTKITDYFTKATDTNTFN